MKTEAIIRVVAFTLLSVLAVVAFLTFAKFRSNLEYVNRAERARNIMITLEQALSSLRDAETNQRAYLLTLDRKFLRTYQRAVNEVNTEMPRLGALITYDGHHRADYDTLRKLIEWRFDAMEQVVSSRELDNEVLYVQGLYFGNSVMTRIRQHVQVMIKREQELLDDSQREMNSMVAITPLFLLVLTLFSILILALGYIFVMRELRLRRSAQRELEVKVDALNRSNRELEQFAYVASHDLQEPLRKIQAFGDRLMHRHGEKVDDDIRAHIDKMRNAAHRMQTLIDDLLSYSRVLHLKKEVEETDLNDVMNSVLADLEVSIRDRNAVLTIDRLPEIVSVRLQMYQLFLNLLSNALKFSKPTSPPEISVKVSEVRGNEIPNSKAEDASRKFYCIAFSDNGIGFKSDFNKKIFLIFQRLHNKMEFGGTGIGLAVCKRIVDNHGGYIDAESQPNIGSTFYVYLPLDSKLTSA